MTVKVPPYEQVWLSSQGDEFDYFEGAPTYRKRSRQALQWLDCPALIRIRGMQTAFVAMRVPFIETLESHCETWQNLIIAPRHGMHEVMELIAELTVRTDAPQLCVLHGGRNNISSCPWSDRVLDETVTRLLKDDFTSFYQREEWFRRNRLPFRRGYLLHGAPGNGKTSVIRAMMWSQRLDAYTLRLFQPTTDDSDLEKLFATAHANRPCMVVLEDLDRAFPKSEESRCRVSLQALLNTLDGLVSTDAIVTVATANHPARLDPAVLQRPGRFDRVVLFDNPDAALRVRYFQTLNPKLQAESLREVIRESTGQSFAELREAYIVAGQLSFERGEDITAADLLAGVRALRSTSAVARRPSDEAGFRPETSACDETRQFMEREE